MVRETNCEGLDELRIGARGSRAWIEKLSPNGFPTLNLGWRKRIRSMTEYFVLQTSGHRESVDGGLSKQQTCKADALDKSSDTSEMPSHVAHPQYAIAEHLFQMKSIHAVSIEKLGDDSE